VTFETPSRLTNIPDLLFTECHWLTTLALPDSITTISARAFDASGGPSIICSDWTTSNDLVMRQGKVFCSLRVRSSMKIPGSVREIGDRVFSAIYRLRDLSFEEGILKVGVSALGGFLKLEKVAFPASLIVIEANAFQDCHSLLQITFALGSRLQYIRSEAFVDCPLNEVVIPSSIIEIDPSAFSDEVWLKCVRFEGQPVLLIDARFIRSVDSTVLFRDFCCQAELLVGSTIEVIGAKAFQKGKVSTVLFESGTRLREIGPAAFSGCRSLKGFEVPESVEIIADHCFEDCFNMETIEFWRRSGLKKIGERAFPGCKLNSITIPALAKEIDGSAFVRSSLISIRVAPGSLSFKVEGNLLVTSDGTEIVRCFGLDRGIIVSKTVKFLRKSCFVSCKHLERIDFELGSELERIDAAALCGCISLDIIDIPSSVTIIDDSSFEGCTELASCLIADDSRLVSIGARAFAKCTSLRSFSPPPLVGDIGSTCFIECIHLYELKFMSSECLKRAIGDRLLDDILDEFGVTGSSSLFRIDVEDGEGVELEFQGWSQVGDCKGDL
jgi:hypothetical protein